MVRHEMRWTLRGLAAVGVVLVVPAAPAVAEDRLPNRTEIQALFADHLNRYDFPPSDVPLWVSVAAWARVAKLVFRTPGDERAGRPSRIDPALLPAQRLTVYQRSGRSRVDYQVIREVVTGVERYAGPTTFFPVIRGTPGSFTFFDSVTEPGPARLTCRTVRQFLACRAIQLEPREVSYQTFRPLGGATGPEPADRELLARFADQRSHWSFRPDPATPWTVDAHWRRVAQIQFEAGTDETVVDPEIIDPIPKELWLLTRTVRHRTEVGIIEWADRSRFGEGELLNPFPDFAGNRERWVFYDTGAIPGFDYQETCRPFRQGTTDFLLCRTILQGSAAFYQTYRRA
jgi:hypothetical protein